MLLQFVVLRRISGHRRTRVLVVMTVLWAAAWLVLGLTGLVPGTAAAAFGVLAFNSVFALGETLLQPTIPAITNDLAPDHLRGRYNAVNAGAFQAGTILGPVAAGFMLNHGWSWGFIVDDRGRLRLDGACSRSSSSGSISPTVNGVTAGDTTLQDRPGHRRARLDRLTATGARLLAACRGHLAECAWKHVIAARSGASTHTRRTTSVVGHWWLTRAGRSPTARARAGSRPAPCWPSRATRPSRRRPPSGPPRPSAG